MLCSKPEWRSVHIRGLRMGYATNALQSVVGLKENRGLRSELELVAPRLTKEAKTLGRHPYPRLAEQGPGADRANGSLVSCGRRAGRGGSGPALGHPERKEDVFPKQNGGGYCISRLVYTLQPLVE